MLAGLFTAAVPVSVSLETTAAAKAVGASALALLCGTRFLLGCAEGGVLPSVNAMVARYAPPWRKSEALGVSYMGF